VKHIASHGGVLIANILIPPLLKYAPTSHCFLYTITFIYYNLGEIKMIKKLKALNPHLAIYNYDDPAFLRYGNIINNYNLNEYADIMKDRPVPGNGNLYVGLDPDLSNCSCSSEIASKLYGGMSIQVGYCNGNNNKLNALEYHKCSEVDIAITDLVLLLGDIRDIRQGSYPSANVEAFFFPTGTACELFATTLHFAPCKVSDKGFKSIIILPEGTNANLSSLPTPTCSEEKLLWMRNKWLIAHFESIPASKGAYTGITGTNIELQYNM